MKNLVVLALAGMVASGAQATVLYATSFEQPTFVSGALNGQDGWSAASSPANLYQVSAAAGGARTGSQFVFANSANGTANGSQWNYRPNIIAPVTSPSIIRASVWTAVVNNTAAAVRRTTSAGLDLYDDTGANRIGAIRIRNDGAVSILNGFNQVASTGAGAVTANAYNQVAIEADFSTHTLSYYVNGTLVGAPVGFGVFDNAVTGFGDADLYITRLFTGVTGETQSGGHTAVFDDFSLETIPAPSSLGLMGVAGLIAARRRRA
ncbi:MAG: hypothetical protein JNK16_14895 [Phycisphaerales bacterium]|nr:hypothetical protein [Phycisphaerales bacterium]